jgi:hypothetical protein
MLADLHDVAYCVDYFEFVLTTSTFDAANVMLGEVLPLLSASLHSSIQDFLLLLEL